MRLIHLIWVVDCDLEASEDLPCGRMLVHGDLKLALRAVLSVKGWRMVVEVHHPDRHRRNVVVQQLAVLPHLWCLGLKNDTISGRISFCVEKEICVQCQRNGFSSRCVLPWLWFRTVHFSAEMDRTSGWCIRWCYLCQTRHRYLKGDHLFEECEKLATNWTQSNLWSVVFTIQNGIMYRVRVALISIFGIHCEYFRALGVKNRKYLMFI